MNQAMVESKGDMALISALPSVRRTSSASKLLEHASEDVFSRACAKLLVANAPVTTTQVTDTIMLYQEAMVVIDLATFVVGGKLTKATVVHLVEDKVDGALVQ